MQNAIIDVALDLIEPSATNPRKYFNPVKLQELSVSVKKVGVIQAVTLRVHPKNAAKYELVCGERRYRASKLAELPTIPAQIKVLTDDEVQEIQFVENIEREDVHPMDEAVTFHAMMNSKTRPWTADDIAAKINKPATYIIHRLQLNSLIPQLQKDFWDGRFLVGHAHLFARLQPVDQQACVMKSEYKTINETKDFIERAVMRRLSAAPFKRDDEDLLPEAGPCTTCSKRSGCNRLLFDDIKDDDRCFDKACFEKKRDIWLVKEVENILETKPELFLLDYGQKVPVEIAKLAAQFKVHILDYRKDEFATSQYGSYTGKSKGIWINGSDPGKYITLYRKLAVKAAMKEKAEAGKITAADIDLQISAIKSRMDRGLELDAEKVWATISATLRDDEKLPQVETLMADMFQEEKTASALALIKAINSSYDEIVAKILGLQIDHYIDHYDVHFARRLENVTWPQLTALMKLLTLSELNQGLSYLQGSGPFALMPMLQHASYFKDDIAALLAAQEEVRKKRVANAQKRIDALLQQKESLPVKKTKTKSKTIAEA